MSIFQFSSISSSSKLYTLPLMKRLKSTLLPYFLLILILSTSLLNLHSDLHSNLSLNPLLSTAQAQFRPQRIPIVSQIKVQGTRRSDPSSIRQILKQKENQPINPLLIRQDIKAIFKQGLYNDIKVDAQEEDQGLVLTYIVQEKPSIRRIIYEGNEELGEDDFSEVVDLEPYRIVSSDQINKNRNKIKDLYIEKGFFLAEVSWDMIPVENQQVDVVFRIKEKDEIKVAQIQIIGNTVLSDEKIKGSLYTRQEGPLSFIDSSGTFNTEEFQKDQSRIMALYLEKGYITTRVEKPTISMSPDRSKLYITLKIEEGPRYKVGLISVNGDLLKSEKEMLELINLEKGEWFNSRKIQEIIALKLNRLYQDQGYAYANIIPNTQVVNASNEVDINFDIRKGPNVKIGRIIIVGNTTTRDKVIRREMRIYEGSNYSSVKIERSQQLITRLGFFETVKIEPIRSSNSELMDLIVKVQEKSTGTFQVGAGFSSIESFVGQAQIAQNNLLGRGQNLSLNATFSSLRSMANLQFSDQYFLDSRVQFSANVYRFDNNFFNFIRQSLGGNLSLGYPITDDFSMSVSYKLEEVNARVGGFGNTVNLQQVTPSNFFNNGITSSISLSFFYDTRNNRLFPSKGIFVSGGIEEANALFGSTNEFTRYTLRHRYYYNLGYNMVLKSNINWGYIVSRSPNGVPIFERFFLGGPMSMRGFFRNSLGPKIRTPSRNYPSASTNSFTLGGTEQIFVNLEYEFPIFQQVGIRGVTFLDSGNAFNRQETYLNKVDQFRFAWGFGIRWFSPIGPLRFEWGFPFTPQENEQDSVFEFSIGNFF